MSFQCLSPALSSSHWRRLSLPDKAGGKKFSKDFEEGSAQLQEFIKFFNSQCKTGPPLLQALSNADIFYEMQYKEVKIVANVSAEWSATCILGRIRGLEDETADQLQTTAAMFTFADFPNLI